MKAKTMRDSEREQMNQQTSHKREELTCETESIVQHPGMMDHIANNKQERDTEE